MGAKCFGYVRVSGKGQTNGDGPERQEQAIRSYADAHGIEVAGIFTDGGVSGTLEDRPALADMMVSMEQNGHGVKTVIVERLDRLARDLMVQEGIIRDFKRQGFELVSAVEGDDLLSDDPTRKLVRQVLGAIAEYEKQMLVLKLRSARRRIKGRTGKCEGRKNYAETDPGLLERIAGLRAEGRTWAEVAAELIRQGIQTRTGRPWTASNVQVLVSKAKRAGRLSA
ncbi:MAG: recombinase family protein [Clostridiaceae bacterium]|nr:recombinase family protein [Clostridiaceae bacterium]